MQQPRQMQKGLGSLRDPRQKYGFGSFVKKFTRPLKKVLKSPLGKAALIGGAAYLGGGALGGTGGFSNFAQLGNSAKNLLLGKMTNTGPASAGISGGLGGLIRRGMGGFNKLSFGQKALLGGGAAAMTLPFLLGGGEEEEIISDPFSTTPSSITDIVSMARARDPSLRFLPQNRYVQENFYTPKADGGVVELANGGGAGQEQMMQALQAEYMKYKQQGGTMPFEQFAKAIMQQQQQGGQQPTQMAADGGMIDYMSSANPMAKSYLMEDTDIVDMYRPGGNRQMAAEGGIMDLGGMEKDYRDEGGFVPLGGEEKADDVPARLSKNEFVFTADAVRNAGGGDIDQGAAVMQRMMDNLEQGGQISEGSQGLGEEEMISEEEIIEEPNGAQAMYDQQQMLQSRIA